MRREGRQHGWVRTWAVLPPTHDSRPKSRIVNILDTLPTAGVFTRVPAKPTNHSKFTGRCTKAACAVCRRCPACKSSGKAKGATKLRQLDAAARGQGLSLHGSSAAEVVGQLTGEDVDGDEHDGGLVESWGSGSEDDHQGLENDGECDGEWFLVEHPNVLPGSIPF